MVGTLCDRLAFALVLACMACAQEDERPPTFGAPCDPEDSRCEPPLECTQTEQCPSFDCEDERMQSQCVSGACDTSSCE